MSLLMRMKYVTCFFFLSFVRVLSQSGNLGPMSHLFTPWESEHLEVKICPARHLTTLHSSSVRHRLMVEDMCTLFFFFFFLPQSARWLDFQVRRSLKLFASFSFSDSAFPRNVTPRTTPEEKTHFFDMWVEIYKKLINIAIQPCGIVVFLSLNVNKNNTNPNKGSSQLSPSLIISPFSFSFLEQQ